jgi:hypothetical protein
MAEITTGLYLATVANLVGGPWLQKIPICDLHGTRYATHLGSPSHPVSPPPLIAVSTLSDETAPPLKCLCKDFQTPLETDGSLKRKIIRKEWAIQEYIYIYIYIWQCVLKSTPSSEL